MGHRDGHLPAEASPADKAGPLVVANHLVKLYEITLPTATEADANPRLAPHVLGFRAGCGPADLLFTMHTPPGYLRLPNAALYATAPLLARSFPPKVCAWR